MMSRTVVLTPAAAAEVRKFMEEQDVAEEAGLRVAAIPGGCGGLQYGLNIDEEPEEDDEIVETEGVRVFVDPLSSQHLSGVELDYVTTAEGSGFIFKNPNSAGGCGCGH